MKRGKEMAEKNVEFNNSDAIHLPKKSDEQQQGQMPNFDGENYLSFYNSLLLVPLDYHNVWDLYVGGNNIPFSNSQFDSILHNDEVPDISSDIVKELQRKRILSMGNSFRLDGGKEEKEKQIEEKEIGGYLKGFPKAKKKRSKRKANRAAWTGLLDFKLRCRHCHTEKTPQWRRGPEGPKTLCNACGVCYRKGKLLPEYRPAGSPAFDQNIHSSYHREILKRKVSMDPSEE